MPDEEWTATVSGPAFHLETTGSAQAVGEQLAVVAHRLAPVPPIYAPHILSDEQEREFREALEREQRRTGGTMP